MNAYLLFILAVLLLSYLLEQSIAFLDLRSLGREIPAELADTYNSEHYLRAREYTRVTTRFGQVRETFMLLVMISFILAGGFNRVDLFVRDWNQGPIVTGLLFIGLLGLLSTIVSLPFFIYSTFVIEERFGLNKTTVKTFVLDLAKALLLAVCIGAPVLAAVLWFFQAAAGMAWLYCWGAVTFFILLLQFLAPVLVMPLFNKFTPLEEGELKKSIMDYARAQQFAMKGIYTMDGSKRSTRLNAFFTGFGRFRRIVFFDTLVEKLSAGEIVAVLAHEMGHFKHKHIFKMMAASILQMGLMFYIMSLFIENRQLFAAFGMEHVSVYAGLLFFGFLYSPISTILSIFFNFFSRKHEYEADDWAVRTSSRPTALISALKKLTEQNLSNLTPHPFHVFVHYSHPPLLERIRAIKKVESR
jgi:STE24 endopeptidase